MLGLRGNDVLLAPLVEPGHALDRHVVRLRRARCENYLRGRQFGRSVGWSIWSAGGSSVRYIVRSLDPSVKSPAVCYVVRLRRAPSEKCLAADRNVA